MEQQPPLDRDEAASQSSDNGRGGGDASQSSPNADSTAAGPDDIGRVLEGLAADRESTATGGAQSQASLEADTVRRGSVAGGDSVESAAKAALQQAAREASQRGDAVFAHPRSETSHVLSLQDLLCRLHILKCRGKPSI